MKLNVGSGFPKPPYTEAGWLNIDSAPEGTITVTREGCEFQRVSVLEMPAEWTNKFEEVRCIHMLEHLNRNLRQQVVNELYRVLAPGCTLYLEVPNFESIIALLHRAYERKDTRSIHIWTTSIYGKQRYEGDSHHWGYSENHLQELARNAGFPKTTVWDSGNLDKMVSKHYQLEPVLLLEAVK